MNLEIWNKCVNRAEMLIKNAGGVFINPTTFQSFTDSEKLAKILYDIEERRIECGYNSIFPTKEEMRRIVPDKKVEVVNDENSDNQ